MEVLDARGACVYLQAVFCQMFLRRIRAGKEIKERFPQQHTAAKPCPFLGLFFASKAKALNCWMRSRRPSHP